MSREIEEFESKIRQIEAETTSMEKSSVMRNAIISKAAIIRVKKTDHTVITKRNIENNAFKNKDDVYNIQSLPQKTLKHEELIKKSKKYKKVIDDADLKCLRSACEKVWVDPTINIWPVDDFRIFCGNLGNDVTDEVLRLAFGKYPSFNMAKVVRDKRTNKSKGYGFVSFSSGNDFNQALRDMNNKFVGTRPVRLIRSKWRGRQVIK